MPIANYATTSNAYPANDTTTPNANRPITPIANYTATPNTNASN